MNLQEYFSSLNIDDEVTIISKNLMGAVVLYGVVSKITKTGRINVIPNSNKSTVWVFDQYGKGFPAGNNSYIVNKHKKEDIDYVNLILLGNKIMASKAKITSFLSRQENDYTPKNMEILTEIEKLLKGWKSGSSR